MNKPRIEKLLHDEWSFHLGNFKNAHEIGFDDDEWRLLDLPHDWSIEGQFKEFRDENWNQFMNLDFRIGYLPQGIGWYRKSFYIPKDYENKKITIQFDGVYRNSDVWINGIHLGHRPYGYSTFYYDLTPHLKFGNNNTIAVKVDNLGVSSRWYAGSGIYRKVILIITDKIHIGQFGTYWTTPNVNEKEAEINIKTTIDNETTNSINSKIIDVKINLISEIYQGSSEMGNEKPIESITTEVNLKKSTNEIAQTITINNPKLWSPIYPNLYRIKSIIVKEGKIIDEYWTPLGLRSFRFDPDQGFFLNDKNIKFKGVCLHHDNGCIGSKIIYRAIERKLEILQEMGCNAIRTSHNPPSQELLELCDKMGFMVMDEAFDEWILPKTPHGYSSYFNEWFDRDVTDFVRRDRNHPSVIIWSCGNEVQEQKYASGIEPLKKLIDVFHREDPTRPVTQGCNNMKEANEFGFADELDIVGYNYWGDKVTKYTDEGFVCRYDEDHKKHPKRILIGSENCSALITRGVYHIPTPFSREGKINDDMLCSAYDVTSEISLMILKSRTYVCGMFTWEGFDYIGEPSPYPWPSRSSNYGIFDLCGFPKDTYYLYKSQWSDKPMVHILPHWNWHKGMSIAVWVYTNCETVELYLNGKSLGELSQKDEDFDDILHLIWDVRYIPGEIKAVGRIKGKYVVSKTIKTAGYPYRVELESDREIIDKNNDLAYITVRSSDIEGNFMPTAQNLVSFKIEGPGKIIGVGNGNPISHEPFIDQQRHLFNGLCLVVIQSTNSTGKIKLKASSGSLIGDYIEIIVK